MPASSAGPSRTPTCATCRPSARRRLVPPDHPRTPSGAAPANDGNCRAWVAVEYENPSAYPGGDVELPNAATAGPGPVDVENDSFTVHNPTAIGADTPMPVLVAALGPVMLQLAGEL